MKALWRFLSSLATAHAASRGPAPLARNQVRRVTHRSVARNMKKWGL